MELIFSGKAKKHIVEIFDWYEEQEDGLGSRFLKELEDSFETIRRQPLSGIVFRVKTRKVLVHKFPYKVFYTIKKRTVIIVAVFHHKKNIKSKRRN